MQFYITTALLHIVNTRGISHLGDMLNDLNWQTLEIRRKNQRLELGITRFCDGLDGLIRDTVFISVFVKPFYTVTVFRQYRF